MMVTGNLVHWKAAWKRFSCVRRGVALISQTALTTLLGIVVGALPDAGTTELVAPIHVEMALKRFAVGGTWTLAMKTNTKVMRSLMRIRASGSHLHRVRRVIFSCNTTTVLMLGA
jgi:hypothetical protein